MNYAKEHSYTVTHGNLYIDSFGTDNTLVQCPTGNWEASYEALYDEDIEECVEELSSTSKSLLEVPIYIALFEYKLKQDKLHGGNKSGEYFAQLISLGMDIKTEFLPFF